MKKKNDKLVLLLIIIVAYAILSWIIPGGVFNNGVYAEANPARAGFFDVFVLMYSAFYYKFTDIFYLFVVGGCYSVLSKTKMYRKLVDKTAKFVEGKEIWVILIFTLLTGAFASLTSDLMVLFALVPFVVSVFLKNGYKRLTAISVAFGGMFIGLFGNTFGTYGLTRLYQDMALDYGNIWLVKLVLFIITYVLYNLFTITYMRKNCDRDESEYDLFPTEDLVEPKNKRSKVAMWPIVLIGVVIILLCTVGYINWESSFGVTVFTDTFTNFQNGFKIGDNAVLSNILGANFAAFGKWADLLVVSFLMFIGTVIVGLIEKISVENFIKLFGNGMKRMIKIAFIYGLAYGILFLYTTYPWPSTIINAIMSSGKFNILIVMLAGLVATMLIGDLEFIGYTFGSVLVVLFADYLEPAALVWHTGEALALLVAPTSFLLLTALTYLDIPYKDWLKYIWKFALSMVFASLLFFVIVLYV